MSLSITNPACRLVAESEWQRHFSPALYRETQQRIKDKQPLNAQQQKVKGAILPFLIVLSNSDQTVLTYIARQQSSTLNRSMADFYHFTPLHIAALRSRPQLIVALLQAGANGTLADKYCWMPVHHAALVSKEVFQTFAQHQSDSLLLKNNLDGTADDLRMLTGLANKPPCNWFFYDAATGTSRLDAVSFEDKTGRMYSERSFYAAERVVSSLWQVKALPLLVEWQVPFSICYEQMCARPPLLSIRRSQLLAGKDFGLTVCTAEVLEESQGLREYTGKIVDSNRETLEEALFSANGLKAHLLGTIDAKERGSGAEIVKEGFPNTFLLPLEHIRGAAKSAMLMTLVPLAKGKELFLDYGGNAPEVKWGRYLLTASNRADMRAFVGQCDEKIHEDINVSQMALRIRLNYIASTPAVLIDLMLHELITAEQLRRWVEMPEVEKALDAAPCQIVWLGELYVLLEEMQKTLKVLPHAVKTCLQEHLYGMLQTHTALQTTQAVYATHVWLTKQLARQKPSELLLEQLQAWQKGQQVVWDNLVWHKDAGFCLTRFQYNCKPSPFLKANWLLQKIRPGAMSNLAGIFTRSSSEIHIA